MYASGGAPGDESKLSLNYNSSSIPYLQRNRKKYNNYIPPNSKQFQVKQAQVKPQLTGMFNLNVIKALP